MFGYGFRLGACKPDDLAPYLVPETKGEADLVVELGTRSFLKVRVEAAEKAEGAVE